MAIMTFADNCYRKLVFFSVFLYNPKNNIDIEIQLKQIDRISQLTSTLANRLSSSLWSGIGWAARLLTLACLTWWFCCWCFQLWVMLLTGDVAIVVCSSCGGSSLESVSPILFVCQFGQCASPDRMSPPKAHSLALTIDALGSTWFHF